MITEEEKQEIINRSVEKALLMLPEIVINLMSNQSMLNKITARFYLDHPEFKENKDIVTSVIEMLEGKNPLLKYEDILKEAIPEITKRIDITKKLNIDNVNSMADRNFKMLEIQETTSHGEI